MAVQVVVLLILGVIVFFLARGGAMKIGHALLCVLLGLYLADTTFLGPLLRQLSNAINGFVSGIRL